MKMLKPALFAMALAVIAPTARTEAVVVSQAAATEIAAAAPAPEPSKKQSRRVARLEKMLEKRLAQKAEKASASAKGIDFSDPVDKWMWLWVIGWGLGLTIGILASGFVFGIVGLSYLSWLCWTGGTVCLIIWLLKKTGTID